ncbi:MAG: ABC transporter ATP-binding protein [Labilithrix sp.]|nr:ABC transporter ATP-binding protein [Labilithrix sp.]MBX3213548.1 ABC transporter ATP-binding protein [Labilithrix sp.]
MIVSSCSGVSHEFVDAGARIVAIDDVSLEVREGELVLLLGPSGSGKSTLLSILAGLLRPLQGEVTLCGAPLAPLDPEGLARLRRAHIGFVYQSFHLFDALSARRNVECVLDLKGLPRANARRALELVGLAARTEHRPAQLSGGERQRVALARALAAEPRIVFGDEPTSSLDARSAGLVVEALRSFVDRGGSVVLATHDPRLYASATRVIALEDGRLAARAGQGRSGRQGAGVHSTDGQR